MEAFSFFISSGAASHDYIYLKTSLVSRESIFSPLQNWCFIGIIASGPFVTSHAFTHFLESRAVRRSKRWTFLICREFDGHRLSLGKTMYKGIVRHAGLLTRFHKLFWLSVQWVPGVCCCDKGWHDSPNDWMENPEGRLQLASVFFLSLSLCSLHTCVSKLLHTESAE